MSDIDLSPCSIETPLSLSWLTLHSCAAFTSEARRTRCPEEQIPSCSTCCLAPWSFETRAFACSWKRLNFVWDRWQTSGHLGETEKKGGRPEREGLVFDGRGQGEGCDSGAWSHAKCDLPVMRRMVGHLRQPRAATWQSTFLKRSWRRPGPQDKRARRARPRQVADWANLRLAWPGSNETPDP